MTGHTLYEVGHSEDQETIEKNLMLNDADLIEGTLVMYIMSALFLVCMQPVFVLL